jgi:putative transposase
MTTSTTPTAELLDQLLASYEKPEDLTGEDGLFRRLKKALIERAPGGAKLTDHLGYEKGKSAGRGSGNSRSGVIVAATNKDTEALTQPRSTSFERQIQGSQMYKELDLSGKVAVFAGGDSGYGIGNRQRPRAARQRSSFQATFRLTQTRPCTSSCLKATAPRACHAIS